ncbi:hypothetical protein F5984_13195 [Rudanella paleaurantiibacter]|uniref:Dystroglycan-type cadherin-like domain-containing protein n=1 Tax=Rudanella paleaurantiibacter TaxID=2614655 RepID=A0A7J5TYD2_9BACT|nr:putative Ig domain-containing protein [Rudanella paleaurantiibacter]KAB7730133.1 hypothetical protein F5984_13195 [Rudanella paleaurantiibacter]
MIHYKLEATEQPGDIEYALSDDLTLAGVQDVSVKTLPEWTTKSDGSPITGGVTYRVFWRIVGDDWREEQYEDLYIPPDPETVDVVGKTLQASQPPTVGAGQVTSIAAWVDATTSEGVAVKTLGEVAIDLITDQVAAKVDLPTATTLFNSISIAGIYTRISVDRVNGFAPGQPITAHKNGTYYGLWTINSVSESEKTLLLTPITGGGYAAVASIPSGSTVALTGWVGMQGATGTAGTNGWVPQLGVVADGQRRVLQVVDWTGGTGAKPATGSYVGATGLVGSLASAVDIRGPQGQQGLPAPVVLATGLDGIEAPTVDSTHTVTVDTAANLSPGMVLGCLPIGGEPVYETFKVLSISGTSVTLQCLGSGAGPSAGYLSEVSFILAGMPGMNGADGQDGADGSDGADGAPAPVILALTGSVMNVTAVGDTGLVTVDTVAYLTPGMVVHCVDGNGVFYGVLRISSVNAGTLSVGYEYLGRGGVGPVVNIGAPVRLVTGGAPGVAFGRMFSLVNAGDNWNNVRTPGVYQVVSTVGWGVTTLPRRLSPAGTLDVRQSRDTITQTYTDMYGSVAMRSCYGFAGSGYSSGDAWSIWQYLTPGSPSIIQGTEEPTQTIRRYDPNARFGSGPYSYYEESTGMWWFVMRMVHDNGTLFSGFWAVEIWEPMFAAQRMMSRKRWYYDGSGWTEFVSVYGANNPPPTPRHVEQLWVAATGHKHICTLPPNTAGTYDSVHISGVIGGWESANKTHIDLFLSNRAALTYSYTLRGPNVSTRLAAFQHADGSVSVWGVGSSGFSTTNLSVHGQQIAYAANFDAAPVVDAPAGATLVFDSGSPDTFPPQMWIQSDRMSVRGGRSIAADRFYAFNTRNLDNADLQNRTFGVLVESDTTKEYVRMSLGQLKWAMGVSVAPIPPQSGTPTTAFTIPVGGYFTDPTGHPLTYSLDGPSGLSISASTGVITGTVSTPGVYQVGVTATDIMGLSESTQFQLTIAGTATPGWSAAYTYDTNTQSVTAFVQSITNDEFEVLLEPLSGQTWPNPDTWRTLVTGQYSLTLGNYNRRYIYPPAFAGGIAITQGNWRITIRRKTLTTESITGIIALGSTNSEVALTTGGGGNQPPVVPGFSVPPAVVGQPYSYTFPTASDPDNDPLTYAITGGAIPGLSFNQSTRTLSGTPTTASNYNRAYRVSDGVAQVDSLFTLQVNSAGSGGQFTIPSFTLPAAVVGLPYSFTLPAGVGGSGVLSHGLLGSLPPGMFFDPITRRLYGTPRGPNNGQFGLTYQATATGGGGGGTTLPYGFDYSIPPSSIPPADGRVVFTGQQGQYERWLDQGGAISFGARRVGGVTRSNMVNNFDTGRQVVISLRSGMQNPNPPGYTKPPVWGGASYNPNEGGDWSDTGSLILDYGFDSNTQTSYHKVQLLNFPLDGYLCGVFYEVWTRLVTVNGREGLRSWYRITVDRSKDAVPDTGYYAGQGQEFPCVHLEMPYPNLAFYLGEQPWTGGGITTVNLTQVEQPTRPLGENWAAGGAGDNWLGIVGPHAWTIAGRQIVDGANPTSNVIYWNNVVRRNLPRNGVFYGTFDVVMSANPEGVREYAAGYTGSRPDARPRLDFRGYTRWQNCSTDNAYLADEGETGALIVTHLNAQPRLFLPEGQYNASDMGTLYVRMRLTGANTPTTLHVQWTRAGQSPGDAAGQAKAFTASTSWQTIAIPLAGTPGWTGKINELSIQQYGPENTPVSGRGWEFEFVSFEDITSTPAVNSTGGGSSETVSVAKTLVVQGCSDYRDISAEATHAFIAHNYWNYSQSTPIAQDGSWRNRSFVSLQEAQQEVLKGYPTGGQLIAFWPVAASSATLAVGVRVRGSRNPDTANSLYPIEAGLHVYDIADTDTNVTGGPTTTSFKWFRTDSCGYITEMGTWTKPTAPTGSKVGFSTNLAKLNVQVVAGPTSDEFGLSNLSNPGYGFYRFDGNGKLGENERSWISYNQLSTVFFERDGLPLLVEWSSTKALNGEYACQQLIVYP